MIFALRLSSDIKILKSKLHERVKRKDTPRLAPQKAANTHAVPGATANAHAAPQPAAASFSGRRWIGTLVLGTRPSMSVHSTCKGLFDRDMSSWPTVTGSGVPLHAYVICALSDGRLLSFRTPYRRRQLSGLPNTPPADAMAARLPQSTALPAGLQLCRAPPSLQLYHTRITVLLRYVVPAPNFPSASLPYDCEYRYNAE